MRPHETAVADNWSAVGGTAIGQDRLPSISVSAFSEQKAFNSKEIDCEQHIKEYNLYHM